MGFWPHLLISVLVVVVFLPEAGRAGSVASIVTWGLGSQPCVRLAFGPSVRCAGPTQHRWQSWESPCMDRKWSWSVSCCMPLCTEPGAEGLNLTFTQNKCILERPKLVSSTPMKFSIMLACSVTTNQALPGLSM